MKRFEFEIGHSILRKLFPPNRVKSKLQVLNILLETIRYCLSYNLDEIHSSQGKIVLIVDKMSRIFFSSENKSYSISFPFLSLQDKEGIRFSFENIDLDAYLVSNLIGVITNEGFMDGSSLELFESLVDFEKENEQIWCILRELLLYEDGYIRYDNDIIGFNKAKENGYEHRHPLNHFDFFYTNRATFKLGSETIIGIDEFIDILNIKTDCKYIKNWR